MKVPEPGCDDVYGVFEGDQCAVYCEYATHTNFYRPEIWECVGDETWQLASEPVPCESDIAGDLGISRAAIVCTSLSLFYLLLALF